MAQRHIYKIDSGSEVHWYSAESEEQALEQYANDNGCSCVQEAQNEELIDGIDELLDTSFLTITIDGEKVNKTCRQWADQGDGMIATTCI